MTLTFEIKPEVQAELVAQAQAFGVDVPTYAAALLEKALARPIVSERTHVSQEKFEETLNRIARFSNKIPVLPDKALGREGLYPDHD